MDATFEHKVRQRAYEMWIASGMGEGEAERHWLHAERIVRNEAEMPTAPDGAEAFAGPTQAKSQNAKSQIARPQDAKPVVVKATIAKTGIAKTGITKAAKTKSAASKSAKRDGVDTAAPRRVKTVSAEASA